MFSYVQNRHGQSVILGNASELASKVGEIVHVQDQGVARLEILHSIGKAFSRKGEAAKVCYGYPDRSPQARDRIVEAEARFAKLAAAQANVVARKAAEAATDADLVQLGRNLEAARAAKPAAKVAAPKLARVIDSTLPAAPAVSDAWLDFRASLLGKVG